ncbi:hypothetical protein JCM10207_008005 [Rhodosporidiobolus poonsookiae]
MAHPVRIFKYPTTGPEDTSPLQRLKDEEGFDAEEVMAVVGKSEGNGCVNDFSRTLSSAVWHPLIPSTSIAIFSGGTEGVLCPHVTFLVKEKEGASTGLVAMAGRTRLFSPEEVGTETQVREVEKTVKGMMDQASLTPADVALILVKCPLLTSFKIASIRAKGLTPVTTDTYDSMAKSRFATALGIAVALEEMEGTAEEVAAGLKSDGEKWSAKASCSSGAELDDCQIMLLANAPGEEVKSTGGKTRLRAVSSFMKDAIDADSLLSLLSPIRAQSGRVLQVFVKAEASPSGLIRSNRHTMSTDSDVHSTRHARAAVGGLIAGLTGDTAVYVSGGAEGQGPPGGGSLTVVYEV